MWDDTLKLVITTRKELLAVCKVFLTADCHFGHKNIAKYRPQFATADEHDETIYHNILSTINKRDTLWLLGDICFSQESWKYLQGISSRVKQINVILGNHDLERGESPTLMDYLSLGNCRIYGSPTSYKGTWLSHCPIHPSEMRGKHLNVHGHSHLLSIPDARYVNVCLEQWEYRPVEFVNAIEKHKSILRGQIGSTIDFYD